MSKRTAKTGGGLQSGLAWAGLVLMLLSVVWWNLLPRRIGDTGARPARQMPSGPIACVVIDAGHGGQDSGAIHAGVQEKDLTLDVAQRLDRLVRAKGLKTILTRDRDDAVSLAQRATTANRERDCVFVSIHFDEGGRAAATGVQTFYATRQLPKQGLVATWLPFLQQVSSDGTNLESQSLARLVQEALVTRTRAVDRGTRAEQFYVVANVRHPAVLVEGGFLSNDADIAKLTTEGYRQDLALAISEAILLYCEMAGQQATATAGEPRT